MDYPDSGASYRHRQRGYCGLAADLGIEPLDAYGFPRPGPYRGRSTNVNQHVFDGFEQYQPKPCGYNHHNYWPQIPLSPNYQGTHQTRSGHSMRQEIPGARPGSSRDTLENPSARGYWRPRLQYHPWPRSARYRCTNPLPSEQEARNYATKFNVQGGLGRHTDFGLGQLPGPQAWFFDIGTMPRAQGDNAHQARWPQGECKFQPSASPKADPSTRVWLEHGHSRQSYDQASPAYIYVERSSYEGNSNSAGDFRSDNIGERCYGRHHGMPGNEELKTTPVHPFLAQRAANSRVNNFYPTARSKPLKRSYADQMASSRPHAVPTTSADSNPVQTPQTQQPSFRYDVPNAAHTQNRQGPSDTARPPPKSGARTSSPWHTARPTGSFRRRKTTKQPQPESESSDHPDSGQSYHSSEESGDRLNSAHQSLPHRTKSTSKRIRQEVHRCAVAANALQMERVQLRREWKKLRGEQATLLQGQRRLRFDWQNLRQERQRNYFRNDDSESMGSSNQSARSSHSDYAEPQARRPQKRQQPEDSDAGRFRPSTPFDQASHQPRLLLEKYNSQWNTLLRSTSPDIPWPTNDLEPASLTKHQHRTPQVIIKSCDPQEVMKWNAFNFFTSAFGIRPTLNKSANKITLGISTAPLEVVKALRQQVREDIKRWHQDKLGCRGAALGSDERAKAVYAAVFELYAVCNERIRRLREI